MRKRRPSLSPVEQQAFGGYLKAVREAQRLSVREVAADLAKTAAKRPTRTTANPVERANASQVRAWESGKIPPSAETLKKLATIYKRSHLGFWARGGYVHEILPFVVAFLKLARMKRSDVPFAGSTFDDVKRASERGDEPAETLFGMWLALRAFPRSYAQHDDWAEIPPAYEDLLMSALPRQPTQLPPLVRKARSALIDPRFKSVLKRRQRAARDFYDWLEQFEPELYRICYAQTYGDEP